MQELEDRSAIQTLRFRFHECVNEKRPDQMALFNSDAELDYAHLGQGPGVRKLSVLSERLSELVPFVKQ